MSDDAVLNAPQGAEEGPGEAEGPAAVPTSPEAKGAARPGVRLALALGGGAAIIGALLVPVALTAGATPASQAGATAATLGATFSGEGATADVSASAQAQGPDVDPPPAATAPSTWRVSQLADDASVTLVDGAVGRRPLLAALGASGLPRVEAQRIVHALGEVRDVDHLAPKDTYTVARDKPTGRVVAFELASSPTDVWQAREAPQPDGAVRLDARKLPLESTQVRVRKAVLVGPDLRASFTDAGFSADVLTLIDDALEGHAELSDIRPGARLRIIATEERVDGVFVRYSSLDAVEYFPATANAPPVRVYFFDGAGEGGAKEHGWYDAKGRQPFHGGWRSPVPLARIASRFNPHRMHPVLHVVMPHNGVDFAAPVGAPVYATAAGEVTSVGNDGPCGNKVEIAHPGGVTSVYCHLSRFAAGLHPGQHVEARQLIAYVGQTGRVTGPHLHFGIKRGGIFIDPMTLRLDGVRVVPRGQRAAFEAGRAELDAELDAIALPAAPDVARPPDGADSESFYEEQ